MLLLSTVRHMASLKSETGRNAGSVAAKKAPGEVGLKSEV
jgi:hypothetical protein